MNMRSLISALSVIVIAASVVHGQEVASQPAPLPQTASGFLNAHFRLIKSDGPRSKNLQRSSGFFRVEEVTDSIQLAIVIDGTDSMTKEFDDLRNNVAKMVAGLQSTFVDKRKVSIEMALVVYRDTGSPSGAVSGGDWRFHDVATLQEELQNIDVQSGTPYFNERPDEGIYQALENLNWEPVGGTGVEDRVTRWMLVVGDAPPYPSGQRKHATSRIVELAVEKRVRIHSVQASSGFVANGTSADPTQLARDKKLLDAAQLAHSDVARFMQELAAKTGGSYVNMWSEDDIRRAMDPQAFLQASMKPITPEDIAARADEPHFGQKLDAVSIAVLPHMSLNPESPNWVVDPEKPNGESNLPVIVVSEIRRVLADVGNGALVVRAESDVLKAVKEKGGQSGDDNARIAGIAQEAKAQYAIWGEYDTKDGQTIFRTALYDGQTGGQIAQQSYDPFPAESQVNVNIVELAIRELCAEAVKTGKLRNNTAKNAFSGANEDVSRKTPIAADLQAQRALLTGLSWLERSLEYARPDREKLPGDAKPAREHLDRAVAYLENARKREPSNPYISLLLSHAYFNLTAYHGSSDEQSKSYQYLEEAYSNRDSEILTSSMSPIRTEIEAYHTLHKRDFAAAIEHFKALTGTGRDVRGRFALRARWMLAGIYMGDWGAKSAGQDGIVDPVKARDEVLEILARWPESPEAMFYKKYLEKAPGDQPSQEYQVPLESQTPGAFY